MPEGPRSLRDKRVRREARECALQFLFAMEFTREDWRDKRDAFWTARPNWAELWQDEPAWAVLPLRKGVRRYADQLIEGILQDRLRLDAAIIEAFENWAPERVGRIEWSILRIAFYEMSAIEDVPDAVAIDEAIEMAKTYGTDESARFINGVLDRLRRNKCNE